MDRIGSAALRGGGRVERAVLVGVDFGVRSRDNRASVMAARAQSLRLDSDESAPQAASPGLANSEAANSGTTNSGSATLSQSTRPRHSMAAARGAQELDAEESLAE